MSSRFNFKTLSNITFQLFLVITSLMTATTWRFSLPFGKAIEADYDPNYFIVCGTFFALVVIFEVFADQLTLNNRFNFIVTYAQFSHLALAVLSGSVIILLIEPQLSLLQLGYFVVVILSCATLIFVYPIRFSKSSNKQTTLTEDFKLLKSKRFLIQIWLYYSIQNRYTHTALGILWVIILPVTSAFIMAFSLTYLLGNRGTDVPFVVFILSATTIFQVFSKVVQQGKNAIVGKMNMLRQTFFPREILIILLVGETLVDFVFTFIAYIIIATLFGITPTWLYIFIPIPLIIMILMASGVAFIVSWLSVIIRDMQQLVGVFLQLMSYMTIFYARGRISPQFEFVGAINPLSAIIETYRSIVLYQELPHFESLAYGSLVAVTVFYFGYMLFKSNEDRFIDYV